VGWEPDLQDQIQNAQKPEAGRYSCWEHLFKVCPEWKA